MSDQDQFQSMDQFRPSFPTSEPMAKGGHQPGRTPGPPEFQAETYPPGTAPSKNSYQSNITIPENSSVASRGDDEILYGATSADVHMGIGKPISGSSSQEVHGLRTKDPEGMATQGGTVELNPVMTQKEADDFKREFEGGRE